VEKQHIYPENDDGEFEKEVFLHVGLDLTIKKLILIYTEGSPILSTTPYRTVPYRFSLQFLSRSRSLSARRTVFYA
jgi:hypothetical protein